MMETAEMNTTKVKMQRYPAYQDSGVVWLGEVPEHWQLRRLGTFFAERRTKVSDKDYEPLSVTKQGVLPQLDSAAKTNDGDNRKLVKTGDFVINSRSDRKGSSGISNRDGSVSLINIVLEPNGIYPMYCNYLLKSYNFVEEYYRNGHGIVADLWTTRYDEMKAILIGIPPLDEQTRIADFLDRKTVQIDQAIAQKERQIELLKERKQILIHNAVTRGLNPNVKMKDSGVEWIGEIPEHWEVKMLKYVFKISKRIAGALGPDVLSITQSGIKIKDIVSGEGQLSMDYSKYQLVYKGDFAMNHMDLLTGYVDISNFDGVMSPDYRVFNLILTNCDNDYMLFLLQMGYKSKVFYAHGQGVSLLGRWRFPTENFNNFQFPIPPYSDQVAIVDFIRLTTGAADKAISINQDEIEKLKEYKTTLINAAVTGKIKV